MKKIGTIIALLAGVLLGGQALAQAPGQSYFGASVGSVWTDGGSPYTINIVNEDTSVGFKAFAGNMLWNKFGLEVGYYNLGKYETDFTGSGKPFMEAETSAISVNGVYTTPLGPGSYMLHPAGEPHFDGAKDVEAIVEIKGMGPAPSVPAAR